MRDGSDLCQVRAEQGDNPSPTVAPVARAPSVVTAGIPSSVKITDSPTKDDCYGNMEKTKGENAPKYCNSEMPSVSVEPETTAPNVKLKLLPQLQSTTLKSEQQFAIRFVMMALMVMPPITNATHVTPAA